MRNDIRVNLTAPADLAPKENIRRLTIQHRPDRPPIRVGRPRDCPLRDHNDHDPACCNLADYIDDLDPLCLPTERFRTDCPLIQGPITVEIDWTAAQAPTGHAGEQES